MNKKTIATAASLQSKSDAAITAFKNLISGLKAANEEAEAAKVANNAQIEVLRAENQAITALFEKNAKIVQNIEGILMI